MTAPAGLTTNVTITGPGGYSQTITSTTTFRGVAPGSYTIAAADVTSKDAIVGSVYHPTVSGSPATVTVGGTATSTVNFAIRPGSGALWVVGAGLSGSNAANGAIGYTVDQLRASSTATPAVHLSFPVTSGGNIDPNVVAIDPQGNLWVANNNSGTLVEYPVSALNASGSPTPAVTIQLPASSVADAMAFDATGNLWAGTLVTNTMFEFTQSQLAESGSPTPAATITPIVDSTGTGGYPVALAFDVHGDLWVLNSTSTNYTLTEYTPNQLTGTGKVIPATIVHSNNVIFAYGMAFDASGNLWLATVAPATLTELSAASLATSGAPLPAVTLTVPGPNPSYATTVAFDNSGDLWYSEFINGNISELVPSQLRTTGSVTPTVAVHYAPTPVFLGLGIAFSPHAAALPLH